MNHKRVERIWRREGLKVPRRQPKRGQVSLASDFIARIENGDENIVERRGVRMSAGQRQRLALARALPTRPELLLPDEAANSPDSLAESEFQRDLENIPGTM